MSTKFHAFWHVKLLSHATRLHYFEVIILRRLTILSFRRRVTWSLVHLTVHASCRTISMYEVSQSHRIKIIIADNPKMISTNHHTRHTNLTTTAIADSKHRHLDCSCAVVCTRIEKSFIDSSTWYRLLKHCRLLHDMPDQITEKVRDKDSRWSMKFGDT